MRGLCSSRRACPKPTDETGRGGDLTRWKRRAHFGATYISNIPLFNFGETSLRVLGTWDEPWLTAKDVCEHIGLQDVHLAVFGDASRGESGLDADEMSIMEVSPDDIPQAVLVLSESGFYHLLLKTNTAQSRDFRRKVFREIMPQLAGTSQYTPADTTQNEEK